jgi:hypothetical protein
MNIMKGPPMRRSIKRWLPRLSTERPLLRWLLSGCFLVGMSPFAGCSSDDGKPSNTATCSAPQVDCNGLCANPVNNALHCGGCGKACAGGEICQNSMCVTGSCPNGETLCKGACVDTQTDAQNCGASCTACGAGKTCEAGVCVAGSSGTAGGGSGGTSANGGNVGTAGKEAMGGSAGNSAGAAGSGNGGGSAGGGSAGSAGTGSTGDCRVWVATTGKDTNDGSAAAPVLTLAKAYELMCPAPPAGTANGAECTGAAPRSICVKPGNYVMTERLEFRKTRMGTAAKPLILQGDPSSKERPVFDFRTQARLTCGANPDNIGGLTVNAHYVTVKNVVVRGANDSCILVQGANDLVENVLTYECADTGIQISSGGEYTGSGTNNTIKNCDSHSNYDVQCKGENADGFAIKEGTGTGNAFIGCRAWNNTDDGYDLFGWTSPVRIEGSWAFDQCKTTEDTGSDCNGFKLGGDGISATHILKDLTSVGNSRGTGNGFTENTNPASLSCTGTCTAWGNKVNVDSVSGVGTTAIGNANVTNMAADAARNADGSLKAASAL